MILNPLYNEEIYITLALIHLNLNQFELAIEYLEHAINLNGKNEVSKMLLQDAMELWCIDVTIEKNKLLDVDLEYTGEDEKDKKLHALGLGF